MTDRTRPPWAGLPHSNEINALLDELRDLTDVEARAMDVAWSAVRGAARRGAARRGAARAAVWGAARRGAAWGASRRGAVLGAAWRDAWESAPGSAQYAAGDTALALVGADLVGQYGLTRAHLDILTGPARAIPRLAAIIDRALPVVEGDEVPAPPSAEKTTPLEVALADYLDALRDLTTTEVEALDATPTITRGAARVAAWFATVRAGRDTAWTTAWDAAQGGAAWFTEYPAARSAAQDASLAIVSADLVNWHGLTRDHLGTLAGPACMIPRLATIIGRVWPEGES